MLQSTRTQHAACLEHPLGAIMMVQLSNRRQHLFMCLCGCCFCIEESVQVALQHETFRQHIRTVEDRHPTAQDVTTMTHSQRCAPGGYLWLQAVI